MVAGDDGAERFGSGHAKHTYACAFHGKHNLVKTYYAYAMWMVPPWLRLSSDEPGIQWHQLMSTDCPAGLMCSLDRELGATHDLSASEFEVLQQLSQSEECSMRMAQLAESAHLTQSALSRLVSRLERDGLLTRKTCDHDRRPCSSRSPTPGVERYADARPTQRRVLREHGSDCLDRAN